MVGQGVDFAGHQPAHVEFVRRDSGLTVIDYPTLYPYGIVFNERQPPFDDRRTRLAAALAVDRREIVDGYLYGFGTAADGPVPPGIPGRAASRPIPTDPDSARRLLAGRRGSLSPPPLGAGGGPCGQG